MIEAWQEPITERNLRVYLETYGCQMNVADSQLVGAILRRAGYERVDAPEQADVILINTCAIREHAEERVVGRIYDLARLRQKRPGLLLGVLGCMAQNHRDSLLKRAPQLDLVVGPDAYRRLPELLDKARYNPTVDVRLNRTESYGDIMPEPEGGVRAYVTIIRGCDQFCTFCIVPYVRGRERSVAPELLMHEVQQLAERGVREVVLLGQTVNAYRWGELDFAGLLKMIARIDGIERIRFTSPHPSFMTESLIEVMATEKKIQPYLHLPVQSGSDKVLQAMGRSYTVDQYMKLVEKLRKAIPELALSTDIIVGFYGEEEHDYLATLDLLQTIRFDSAFIFKYSRRAHTKAFKLGDTVDETEKLRRLREAIDLQEKISLECNERLIGRTFPVLIEGPARRGEGMLAGKTPQFKTVVLPASPGLAVGQTVPVKINAATSHSLSGLAISALSSGNQFETAV